MEIVIKKESVLLNNWGSTGRVFERLITEVRPDNIIEVGTWRGASAIHMAGIIKKLSLPTKITCVDTWLGALEFHTRPIPERDLQLVEGYPTVYYQFLHNVREAGHEDIIKPFPNTSNIAYWYFRKNNIKADLIYIDASHEYLDVKNDINNYTNLLSPNGIIFGDDYNPRDWPGVVEAYNEVCQENLIEKEVIDNNYWVIRRNKIQ